LGKNLVSFLYRCGWFYTFLKTVIRSRDSAYTARSAPRGSISHLCCLQPTGYVTCELPAGTLQPSAWMFTLPYAALGAVLPLMQQLLAACRLPRPEAAAALEVGLGAVQARLLSQASLRQVQLWARLVQAFVRSREDAAAFDTSRLADFSETILLDVPATQVLIARFPCRRLKGSHRQVLSRNASWLPRS
jgi:hypothetical protein